MLDNPMSPSIQIHNYVAERTIDYRATISFTADKVSAPEGSHVEWLVTWDKGGNSYGSGDTFRLENVKDGFSVQAKLWGKDGDSNVLYGTSESQHVTVKSGFFDRVKAFFRGLFRKLPVITQEYLGIEIYE